MSSNIIDNDEVESEPKWARIRFDGEGQTRATSSPSESPRPVSAVKREAKEAADEDEDGPVQDIPTLEMTPSEERLLRELGMITDDDLTVKRPNRKLPKSENRKLASGGANAVPASGPGLKELITAEISALRRKEHRTKGAVLGAAGTVTSLNGKTAVINLCSTVKAPTTVPTPLKNKATVINIGSSNNVEALIALKKRVTALGTTSKHLAGLTNSKSGSLERAEMKNETTGDVTMHTNDVTEMDHSYALARKDQQEAGQLSSSVGKCQRETDQSAAENRLAGKPPTNEELQKYLQKARERTERLIREVETKSATISDDVTSGLKLKYPRKRSHISFIQR